MRCPPDSGWYFNPRSPHGERRYPLPCKNRAVPISIHAPRTGSDPRQSFLILAYFLISIHAPRTGSDCIYRLPSIVQAHFNPRSPHGERPGLVQGIATGDFSFQSTLPARGATLHIVGAVLANQISIHAPRTGSDATC